MKMILWKRCIRPRAGFCTSACLTVILSVFATLPATLPAQFTSGTISVDFNSDAGGASQGGTNDAPSQNAVVTPGIWNAVDAGNNVAVNTSGILLNDSGGMLTAARLAYTADGSFNVSPYLSTDGKANSPNLGLLEDFIFSGSTTTASTITLSGLSVGTKYNLYLYSSGNSNGRETIFNVGGVTKGAAYSDQDTNFIPSDNYVQYLNLTPSTGGIITVSYMAGAGNEGDVNGFQLVAIPAAVPEPSSVALLVSGGVATAGFAACRRRARA